MLILDFVLSKVWSKILLSEFRYDYIKARYSRNLNYYSLTLIVDA